MIKVAYQNVNSSYLQSTPTRSVAHTQCSLAGLHLAKRTPGVSIDPRGKWHTFRHWNFRGGKEIAWISV